jgi:predicted sulfurtransferase
MNVDVVALRRHRRLVLVSLAGLSAGCGIRVVNPSATPTRVAPVSDEAVARIDVQGAHAKWRDGSAVFVDTRNPDAFAAGHISGAVGLPLADVTNDPAAARQRLPAGKLAIFYCT